MKYRPEIDGLRAVAVIPVILFHAGFSLFQGGFVGVDVFFVISGYLITTIIIQETKKDSFTIAGFYERRARRILPALFLVLLVTIPFAWLWMWPSALRDFSKSLISVVTFVSNIFFWQERGYFDAVGELKPLLHTWSLAVEEQFYLVFPLVFAFIWRFGRRFSFAVIVIVGLASFGIAEWASVHRPGAAFYLIVTRAWELLIGVLAAMYLSERDATTQSPDGFSKQILATLGLGLIIFSIVAFDSLTPFPGVFALVPTVGAAMIILYAEQGTVVGRILSTKTLVGIGLISYSAYLWHQPLLAMARHRSIAEPSTLIVSIICVAIFPLSYLSWKFVEGPFRGKKRFTRRQIFTFSLVGSLLFLIVGILGVRFGEYARQLPPNVRWEDLGQKIETIGEICVPAAVEGFPGITVCYFGDQKAERTVALYGDSHARMVSWQLDNDLATRGIRGVRVVIPDCETVPTVFERRIASATGRDRCGAGFRSALDFFDRNTSDVVILSRWTYFMYPVKGEIDSLSFENGEGGFERNTHSSYVAVADDGSLSYAGSDKAAVLGTFLKDLSSLKPRVSIVYPVPEVGWDIAKLNGETYERTGGLLETIATSEAAYRVRHRFVNTIFDDAAKSGSKLLFVRPQTIFCSTFLKDRCVAQWDTIPFYDDDDHLSDAGSEMLIKHIFQRLGIE